MEHKQAEVASRTAAFMAVESTKPFGWSPAHFVEWATVTHVLQAIGVGPGASVLDVGCGSGWTSLFLAEAGYAVTGCDLVQANVELGRRRAARWSSGASFLQADMEALGAGPLVDLVLIFDALHHSDRQRDALRSAHERLKPGGWLVLGEPTWLHRLSPGARRARRELGWLERVLTLRGLRRDLAATGFAPPRRFFQPTEPYEGSPRAFARQLARLVLADVAAAPRAHLWVAAQRPGA